MRKHLILVGLLLLTAVSVKAQDWGPIYKQVYENHLIELRMGSGRCTGVVIRENQVLTAAHCTQGTEEPITADGQPTEHLGHVVPLDLALLRTKTTKTPIPMVTGTPWPGTEVVAIGYTGGKTTPSITTLHIMGIDPDYVRLDGNLQFGYSGGPLVDINGMLVGINVGMLLGPPIDPFSGEILFPSMVNVGFAVTIERVKVFLAMMDVGLNVD